MYKIHFGERVLAFPRIEPGLVRSVRRLGYEPLASDTVSSKLDEAGVAAGSSAVLCAAGISVLADNGYGLWPTRAFTNALIAFKSKSVPPEALSRDESIALALSVPERFSGFFSQDAMKDHFPDGPSSVGCGDLRGCSSLVGSYLKASSEARVPDTLELFLLEALMIEYSNYANRESKKSSPIETNFYPGWKRDLLLNQVKIGPRVMPDAAWRLNIEILAGTLHESIGKAAYTLAALIAEGRNVSAKFTMSNLRPSGSTGTRLLIYVPSAALMPTLAAASRSGLFEGEIDVRGDIDSLRHVHTGILFPNFVNLRTSGEGGGSSIAQGLEALEAVSRLNVPHRVLSSNRYYDVRENTLDLGGGEIVNLFPAPKSDL